MSEICFTQKMDILSPTGEKKKTQLLPFNYETDLLNSL